MLLETSEETVITVGVLLETSNEKVTTLSMRAESWRGQRPSCEGAFGCDGRILAHRRTDVSTREVKR